MKTGGPARGAGSSGEAPDATAAAAAAEAVRLVRGLAGGASAVAAGRSARGPAVEPAPGSAAEPPSWTEAAGVLAALNLDAHGVAAGLAGLLVERGAVGLDAVRAHLGAEAAALVEGLLRFDELRSFSAEDPAPAGRNTGAERAKQVERLRRLLLAVVDDVRILIVQLALTLHRLRTVRERPRAERKRLAREGLEIYAPLASRLGIWQYKWEIEDLAFRESDPVTYKAIAGQLNERRVDRERYVEEAVRRVRARLRGEGIDAEVAGRAKHIHSIWRKMQRKSLGIEQAGIEKLFDLRALRVLVDTEAECYTALGAVHGLWTHIPREFDDYVTHPKPNGYRSLHTAVVGPGGRTLEVQIRTREMHAQAELGIAAHWRYKEGARRPEPGPDTRHRVAAAAPGDRRRRRRNRIPARHARPGDRVGAGLRLHPAGRRRRPPGRLDPARLRLPDPHRGRPPLPGREGRRADRAPDVHGPHGGSDRGADHPAPAPQPRLAQPQPRLPRQRPLAGEGAALVQAPGSRAQRGGRTGESGIGS